MLRFRNLTRITRYCRLHQSYLYRQNALPSAVSPVRRTNHFKDEDEITSVQERALFEQVFEKIMKKEEQRKKNSNDIYLGTVSVDKTEEKREYGVDNNKGLQVVFEKKKEAIHADDRKLLDFFKNTSGTHNVGEIGESAKLTTDDIRNYPVSLVSNIFTDINEKKTENTALPSKKLLKNIVGSPLDGIQVKKELDLRLNKEVLRKLEAKERFKAAMESILEPFLTFIFHQVETDYDLLTLVRKLLEEYSHRNKIDDTGEPNTPDKVIEYIKIQCKEYNTRLPQPYRITLPFVLVKLLNSKELDFPSERKYNIASYIYTECKKCADISLYLNVCNVDFYNLFLQLSWDNFREIHQLKQLTTEMSINGIQGDINTVEILNKVVHDLRHINDGIIDEETRTIEGTPLAVSVVWCRENSVDLMVVENYLKKLKESLI